MIYSETECVSVRLHQNFLGLGLHEKCKKCLPLYTLFFLWMSSTRPLHLSERYFEDDTHQYNIEVWDLRLTHCWAHQHVRSWLVHRRHSHSHWRQAQVPLHPALPAQAHRWRCCVLLAACAEGRSKGSACDPGLPHPCLHVPDIHSPVRGRRLPAAVGWTGQSDWSTRVVQHEMTENHECSFPWWRHYQKFLERWYRHKTTVSLNTGFDRDL